MNCTWLLTVYTWLQFDCRDNHTNNELNLPNSCRHFANGFCILKSIWLNALSKYFSAGSPCRVLGEGFYSSVLWPQQRFFFCCCLTHLLFPFCFLLSSLCHFCFGGTDQKSMTAHAELLGCSVRNWCHGHLHGIHTHSQRIPYEFPVNSLLPHLFPPVLHGVLLQGDKRGHCLMQGELLGLNKVS